MIVKKERSTENILGFEVTGKINKKDYEDLVPEVQKAIETYGSVKLLIDLNQFKGEKINAWGSDFKFGKTYRKKITKMAIVGDKKLEKLIAKLAKPFFAKESKFFKSANIEEAWIWLNLNNDSTI